MTDRRIALLLTRPLAQSKGFVNLFEGVSQPSPIHICISPLFEIIFQGPLPDMSPYRSLIFTSSNGVRAFSQLKPSSILPSFTVGKVTAETAISVGLPAQMLGLDVQDFTEAILSLKPETPCLHLRGDITPSALATQLSNAGLATDEAIVYRQRGLPLTKEAQQILLGTDPVIVPLFSPRSAQRFRAEFVKTSGTAPIYGVALSKAVATEMSGINLADLVVAEQPTATAMGKAINNLVATLIHLERAPVTK